MIAFLFSVIFILFLPGYLLSLIINKYVTSTERIIIAIAYSIMMDVAIGFLLGGNSAIFQVTGGYQKSTVVAILATLCLIFFIISLIWRKK
jgi:uncharacterized membrane protein